MFWISFQWYWLRHIWRFCKHSYVACQNVCYVVQYASKIRTGKVSSHQARIVPLEFSTFLKITYTQNEKYLSLFKCRKIWTKYICQLQKMGVYALDHFKSFKMMDEDLRRCDSSSFGIKDNYNFILSDVARLHMIAFW